MSRGVWTAGISAFTQKAVFKAQTEREVSQWENKLKENTETKVWEVFVFPSQACPLEWGWRLGISYPLSSEAWDLGPCSGGAPGSSVGLAMAEQCFSKCGLGTGARPQAACYQPMMG